jgi:NACHT domain
MDDMQAVWAALLAHRYWVVGGFVLFTIVLGALSKLGEMALDGLLRAIPSVNGLRRYRQAVVRSYQMHPLGFISQSIDLLSVYQPVEYSSSGGRDLVSNLLASNLRTVVVGPAGAGKTLLLKNLLLRWGEQRGQDIGRIGIPILIELRKFNGTDGHLIDLILRELRRCDIARPTRVMQRAGKRGGVFFMFDGLDEVAREIRDSAVLALRDIARDFPKCRVAVTCRDTGYSTELTDNGQPFNVIRIADLDDAAMIRLLKQLPLGEGEDSRLIEILRARHALLQLARNPLLLTIIGYVYSKSGGIKGLRSLPTSRAGFYDQAIRHLLERDDVMGVHGTSRGPETAQQYSVLRALALAMLDGKVGSDRITFQYAEAGAFCRDELDRQGSSSHADQMLRILVERSQLIEPVENDSTQFRFRHLTLRDALAAQQLRDDPTGLMTRYRSAEDDWRDVILLWMGTDPPTASQVTFALFPAQNPLRLTPQATPAAAPDRSRGLAERLFHLVRPFSPSGPAKGGPIENPIANPEHVTSAPDDNQTTSGQDFAARNRLLALECLTETATVAANVALNIISFFESQLSAADCDPRIIASLGSLAGQDAYGGAELFTRLRAKAGAGSSDSRGAAQKALAATGRPEAADYLVGLLESDPGAAEAIRRMGQVALHSLSRAAVAGSVAAVDIAASIGTPDAVRAQLELLACKGAVSERAAWRLAELTSDDAILDLLRGIRPEATRLPDDVTARAQDYQWVWEPFAGGKQEGCLPLIMPYIAGVMDSPTVPVPDDIVTINWRIALPIAVIGVAQHRIPQRGGLVYDIARLLLGGGRRQSAVPEELWRDKLPTNDSPDSLSVRQSLTQVFTPYVDSHYNRILTLLPSALLAAAVPGLFSASSRTNPSRRDWEIVRQDGGEQKGALAAWLDNWLWRIGALLIIILAIITIGMISVIGAFFAPGTYGLVRLSLVFFALAIAGLVLWLLNSYFDTEVFGQLAFGFSLAAFLVLAVDSVILFVRWLGGLLGSAVLGIPILVTILIVLYAPKAKSSVGHSPDPLLRELLALAEKDTGDTAKTIIRKAS